MENIHDILQRDIEQLFWDIPCINFGGCGIFALWFYKALTDLGINSTIMVDADSEELGNIYYIRDHNRLQDDVQTFSHAVVVIDNISYDCHGNVTEEYDPAFLEEITIKELEILIKKSRGWNSTFDREAYTPFIKKAFKEFTQKYLNKVNQKQWELC